MTDLSLIAIRRELAFKRAGQILGVDSPVPSTKASPVQMQTYLAELLLALAERVEKLETALTAAPEDDTADLTGDLADE